MGWSLYDSAFLEIRRAHVDRPDGMWSHEFLKRHVCKCDVNELSKDQELAN